MTHPHDPLNGGNRILPPSPVIPTVRYTGKKGRPKIVLPEAQIAALATIQCTLEEIAYCTGISLSMLKQNRRVRQIVAENAAKGKMSVKRAHYAAAIAGEAWAVIHWDRRYNGFNDRAGSGELPPGSETPVMPVVVMLPHDGRDPVHETLTAIPEADAREVLPASFDGTQAP